MHRTLRSMRPCRVLPTGILLLSLSTAFPALAQSPSPEDIAAARALGTEGTRLADAGDCNGAIGKLEAAEKLYHAPTTLDRLGECQVSVGRIVAGTENLNRVVRESLAANAPPVFAAAQKRAQKALTAALPRIGNLKIHVDGAPADKLTITVDGVAVPPALLDADRPTDPGSHEVSVAAPGYKTETTTVAVQEGGESAVQLKLEVDPSAVAAAPAPAIVVAPASPPGPTEAPPSKTTDRSVAIAGFVAGGVGLVVGSVFGILALGTKSTLDSKCISKTCPPDQQSNIDSLSTKATVSTVGFGVGIAGVALGAIFLGLSQHNSGGSTTGKVEPPRPRVSPWIGLGSAGLGGTFQ
ncbi:MAG TPA: hypothetical protein VK762_23060 [Polyangiaceae bacterium]|jgi:hypothetical protein|nr:hypothetical protein [Polyangiaceae bacterium]